MFNVTGGELVIILLVALIVLGPDKLPDAIRKVGRVYGELRRMSQGFQSEIRDALDEPMREVRDTMNTVKGGFTGEDSPGGTRLTAPEPDAPATNGAAAAPPEPEPESEPPMERQPDPERPIDVAPEALDPVAPAPPASNGSAPTSTPDDAAADRPVENERS